MEIIIIIIILLLVCYCISLLGNNLYFFSQSSTSTKPTKNKENKKIVSKVEPDKVKLENKKPIEPDKVNSEEEKSIEKNRVNSEEEKALEEIYKEIMDKAEAYKTAVDKAKLEKSLLRKEIVNFLKMEWSLYNEGKNILTILNNTKQNIKESVKKINLISDLQKNRQEILDLHKKFRVESFELDYDPPDMRILYDCSNKKCNLNIQPHDIIIVPNLFCEQNNFDIYNKLIEEMDTCGINKDKLWILWHGKTHLIADDELSWSKKNIPTFNMIIDKISKFFNMDIYQTRFNFYRDNNDWKPFHRDPADIKSDNEKVLNFTVGVSFGSTRDIAFEDALEPIGHRRIISLPLPNGSTYCFTRDININWKHGVIPIDPNKNVPSTFGRISIIAWGYINKQEVK